MTEAEKLTANKEGSKIFSKNAIAGKGLGEVASKADIIGGYKSLQKLNGMGSSTNVGKDDVFYFREDSRSKTKRVFDKEEREKVDKERKEQKEKTTNLYLRTKGEKNVLKSKCTLVGMDNIIIQFKVDDGISLFNRPYEITLSTGKKVMGKVGENNTIKNSVLPDGKHKFRFTLPKGYDAPVKQIKPQIIKGMVITDETRDIVLIKASKNEIKIKYTTYTYEPLKKDFNQGLTSASNSYMKKILGSPSSAYSIKCSELTTTYKKKVKTDSVGPFRVTGLKQAVDSLKDVFKVIFFS